MKTQNIRHIASLERTHERGSLWKAITIIVVISVLSPLSALAQGSALNPVKTPPSNQKGRFVWVPDSVAETLETVIGAVIGLEKSALSHKYSHEEVVSRKETKGSKYAELWSSFDTVAQPLVKNADYANTLIVYRDIRVVDSVRHNEKVLFRGDTIPMILKSRNFGRYDRNMPNYMFHPKGQWQFALTASYGDFNSDNLELMSLIKDIGLNAYMFSVRPTVSYFIKHNVSVGVRFGYTAAKVGIDSFKLNIDDDMNFNLHDIEYRSESYSAAAVLTQYVGLGRRGRFSIFNEAELAFSSGSSNFIRPYNDELKHTHSTNAKVALNFSPGVAVKMMQNVAFHVSFGIFGFHLKNEKQTVDGVPAGNRFTSGANFRFNIFNINFGMAVHI